jgi:hypothetical protein
LISPETDVWPTAGVAGDTVHVDQAAATTRDLLDEVISHIHRAGLLINTYSEVVRPPLVDKLVHLNGEVDALIYRLQTAFSENHDTLTLTGFPSPLVHWAWSETERRWVNMTFDEYQAWLARPDLDPVTIAGWSGP